MIRADAASGVRLAGLVQVLNPSAPRFAELQPLLREAYALAVKKFEKKMSAR